MYNNFTTAAYIYTFLSLFELYIYIYSFIDLHNIKISLKRKIIDAFNLYRKGYIVKVDSKDLIIKH